MVLSWRRAKYRFNFIKAANLGIFSYNKKDIIDIIKEFITSNYLDITKRFVRKAIRDLGEEVPNDIKIYPVRHHLAHAASAYYFSGFQSATILTIDGSGEHESTVIWKVKDGNFEEVLSLHTSYASLGFLYEK